MTRRDHFHLRESDVCYYIGEYTSHEDYAYSRTNQLIHNLKKSMDRRGRSEWRYKARAIEEAARAFQSAIPDELLDQLTFVPIPPSKSKAHSLYDDRITRMLHLVRPQASLDLRELIIQAESTEAAHAIDSRPSPETIEANYRLDTSLIEPKPKALVLVDDILTTGAHFRAAKTVLERRFPSMPIMGMFIARRVFSTAS